MAFQILHAGRGPNGIVRHNCFTLSQMKAYLWGLKIHPSTIITIADLFTMESASGTRKTLINALGNAEEPGDLWK